MKFTDSLQAQILLRKKIVQLPDVDIKTVNDVGSLLKKVDSLKLCAGYTDDPMSPEWSPRCTSYVNGYPRDSVRCLFYKLARRRLQKRKPKRSKEDQKNICEKKKMKSQKTRRLRGKVCEKTNYMTTDRETFVRSINSFIILLVGASSSRRNQGTKI